MAQMSEKRMNSQLKQGTCQITKRSRGEFTPESVVMGSYVLTRISDLRHARAPDLLPGVPGRC